MNRTKLWNRRSVLQAVGAGTLGALSASCLKAERLAEQSQEVKGKIKQSICRWCYAGIKLDQLAAAAAKIGYKSIELLGIDEYKVVKPYGLTCAMIRCKSISH